MFKGAIVAIVTPFKAGKVDERAFRELIEFQIDNGVSGIVPCGTTGESSTLSHEEHDRVIEIAIEAVNKRVSVIAGTGSNSTEEALRLTRHAWQAGADAALVVTPYYNRPTQEGLYQHYRAIAEDTPLPIIPYNVPSRTGVNLLPETLARLAEIKNIVAVKEASGSIKQINDILALCGESFDVLSGDDLIVLPLLAMGARGVISVVANVAPGLMSEMIAAFAAGNVILAREIHFRLSPLMDALFIETNPIPVKAALTMMGRIEYELRAPLCRMLPANYEKLRQVMTAAGLI